MLTRRLSHSMTGRELLPLAFFCAGQSADMAVPLFANLDPAPSVLTHRVILRGTCTSTRSPSLDPFYSQSPRASHDVRLLVFYRPAKRYPFPCLHPSNSSPSPAAAAAADATAVSPPGWVRPSPHSPLPMGQGHFIKTHTHTHPDALGTARRLAPGSSSLDMRARV